MSGNHHLKFLRVCVAGTLLLVLSHPSYLYGTGKKDGGTDKFLDDQEKMIKGIIFGAAQKTVSKAAEPVAGEAAGGIIGYAVGAFVCSRGWVPENLLVGKNDDEKKSSCQQTLGTVLGVLGLGAGAAIKHGPSNMWWWFLGNFGYVRRPDGLSRVYPRSHTHPDGAIAYEDLIFDPSDPASIKIRSTVKSMRAKNRLRNAIYFGDAGTGKSSAIQSFAHIDGYEVWSISGSEMTLEQFEHLTKWVKVSSSYTRKILIDISEGDSILFNLATDAKFKIFFKQNYAASQENYALFFSCNYNREVNVALSTISKDQALARRLEDRIRFSIPGTVVRISLLMDAVTKTLNRDAFEDDEAAVDFFQKEFFNDKIFLRDYVVPGTQGLSHSQVLTLGEKIVYLYLEARDELAEGLSDNVKKFEYLSEREGGMRLKTPKEKIQDFLDDKGAEGQWLQDEKAKLMKQEMDSILEELPLYELRAKLRKLQSDARSGKVQKKSKKRSRDDDDDDDD